MPDTDFGLQKAYLCLLTLSQIDLSEDMTDIEKQLIYNALKRNVPEYFNTLMLRLKQKKDMITNCIEIACHSDNVGYQDDINRLYNTCCSLMNKTETYLLNYICLIKHKEHVYGGIQKNDQDIQRWVKNLNRFRQSEDSVIAILDKMSCRIIRQYRIKNAVGRPKGSGKHIYIYNGKEYRTIQECAEDYGISKQGMHKRLKKLNII